MEEIDERSSPKDELFRFMSAAEVATYLRVSIRTIRRWSLPAYKIGQIVRYDRRDIDAYVERHRIDAKKAFVFAPSSRARCRASRTPRPREHPHEGLTAELRRILLS
jgi:excisionase family DNA binding protein